MLTNQAALPDLHKETPILYALGTTASYILRKTSRGKEGKEGWLSRYILSIKCLRPMSAYVSKYCETNRAQSLPCVSNYGGDMGQGGLIQASRVVM